MKTLSHFIQLIRLTNLLVIGGTMAIVQYFLGKYDLAGTEIFNVNFILLLTSTILIAAAGNIINDYFDIKADRVNKPERLIVGKTIKRRWAMLLHWTLTTIGFCIALYLGWAQKNWMIPIISFISCNLLYFYSAVYKRKFMSGNGMVATLIAIIPIYVLVFNMQFNSEKPMAYLEHYMSSNERVVSIIFALSFFAFYLNLIREIVKDIADVKGDLLLGSQTLPIKLGYRKAKAIVFSMFMLLAAVLVVVIYIFYQKIPAIYSSAIPNSHPNISFYLLIASLLSILLGAYFLIRSHRRKDYLLCSNLLKVAMLFGLITPIFL